MLIHGEELSRLMVRNEIGVRTKMTVQGTRVAKDYFDPEELEETWSTRWAGRKLEATGPAVDRRAE
ncbi:MAG: hypothetical protein OXN89_00005 [Bryobacterales bacterium]|nr:hypothetical protein [Bryobacterales bacterium]